MFARLFVLLSMIVFTPFALAEDVKVGASTITFVTPPGYCELEPDKANDARMLTSIRMMIEPIGNSLLSASADCKQLTDWRTGARPLLSDMTQYQTITVWMDRDLPEGAQSVVKESCAKLRAEGKKLASNMLPNVQSRAAEVIKGMKINEIRFLGVLDENPNVCYAALLQKFRAQNGADVTQLAIYATMFVKGKAIYYYLYSPYAGADSMTAALASHKNNVAAFIAANKN